MTGRRPSVPRAAFAGLVLAAAALAAGEGLLVFLDADPPWDSLHRAYRASRLFVPAVVDGEPGFRVRTSHRRVFPDLRFRADPGGAFRIMACGGSFTQGWGLADPASQAFAARFGDRLAAASPRRPVEVINCGAPGYGAYRIAPLVEELVRHRPHLLLVFTGHNEFWEHAVHRDLTASRATAARVVAALEPLRLYRGLGWALEEANRRWLGFATDWGGRYEAIDDGEAARAAAEFRDRLDRIAATCRAAGVPLVLGTVPVNLRCDPDTADSTCRGASRHPAGLDGAARAAFAATVAAGRRAESASRFAEALGRYDAAREIDPGYGWIEYRRGRCLEALGRAGAAREAYWRHVEACRRTVTREWNGLIRDAGRRHGVPLADAAAWFGEGEPAGVPRARWFLDDAHLSPAGQERLAARLFAERRRLLQNTVYMKGRVLDPATMSSAAASRTAASGTIHHARRSRANATRSRKRRAA